MTTSRDVEVPPDTPPQTLILLDRVRRGDTAAVNGLLERHRAAILRMIDQRLDRVVRKRVYASDIVQDVLVEANRRLGTYLTNPTMPFQFPFVPFPKSNILLLFCPNVPNRDIDDTIFQSTDNQRLK